VQNVGFPLKITGYSSGISRSVLATLIFLSPIYPYSTMSAPALKDNKTSFLTSMGFLTKIVDTIFFLMLIFYFNPKL